MSNEHGEARKPFRLEEATIDELHAAIRAGETTCVAVVDHYIARARAYNGVASLLVTGDGASVPEAAGTVRAGVPLRFPSETVAASTIFPDLAKYQGPPLEFGRIHLLVVFTRPCFQRAAIRAVAAFGAFACCDAAAATPRTGSVLAFNVRHALRVLLYPIDWSIGDCRRLVERVPAPAWFL